MKVYIGRVSSLAVLLFFAAMASSGQDPNSWKVIGPGGGGTTILATISPHDSRLVATASDMTGGYITRDDGQSWRMFNLHEEFNVIAFDPVDPLVIYACNAALWRSATPAVPGRCSFPALPAIPSRMRPATAPITASRQAIPHTPAD